MPEIRTALLLALGVVGIAFAAFWLRDLLRHRKETREGPPEEAVAAAVGWPTPLLALIGLLTDFFDFLGIGSFATTTSVYRMARLVPDGLIPGTLLIGHMLPTVAQALISITIIEVDMSTLVLLIGAATLGAWLGAGVVTRWPKRRIQVGMGLALLGAASLLLAKATHALPGGGDTIGLVGWRLGAGLVGNFVFGALMNIGIGAYLPSLLLFGLLGMDLKAVFPVMMGSCAFIMPASGFRFIGRGRYAPRAALGLALGGVPGVLLAAYVVKGLAIDSLLWIVVVVAAWTAVSMLLAAHREARSERPA
jgi:uncharacterized membrane protein YfcA